MKHISRVIYEGLSVLILPLGANYKGDALTTVFHLNRR